MHLFWLGNIIISDNYREFILILFFPFFLSSLFSLLSKKHNKVLEQATQSLRGSLDSNDTPLPDYVSTELSVLEGASK